jgi:hypothetical protein
MAVCAIEPWLKGWELVLHSVRRSLNDSQSDITIKFIARKDQESEIHPVLVTLKEQNAAIGLAHGVVGVTVDRAIGASSNR